MGSVGAVRKRRREARRRSAGPASMLCAMTHAMPEEAQAVGALLLGAGRGKRLGHALPKAFVPIAGLTLLERSARALLESGAVGLLQPVLDPADFERFAALGLEEVAGLAKPVAGGAERQDSVRAGLAALPARIEWVVVHDAARCLVTPVDVRRVVEAARREGAAILAERVRDTIKLVREGVVAETPPRESCWAAQTPQVARRDWLEAAMEAASSTGRVGTDDAQLLEWIGRPVRIVASSAPNPKLTLPEDLAAAEAWLAGRGEDGGR